MIVALLILAVITVPLLQTFTTAARVNRVNAQKTAADAVAANIMEAVKVYGIEGTARELDKAEKDTADHLVTPSCFGLNVNGVSSISGRAVKDYLDRARKDYACTVSGITEGTGSFSVDINVNTEHSGKISFSGSGEGSYDYAAFRENTVFINPLGVADTYYDEIAIEWFKDSNRRYYEYISSLPADHPDAGTHVTLADDNRIKNEMTRDFIITISNNTGESVKPYKVSAKITYTISSYDGLLDEETTFTGYNNEFDLDKLSNIYLFYVPFPYLDETEVEGMKSMISGGYTPTFGITDADAVYINSSVDQQIDFYISLQGNCADDDILYVYTDSNKINLYSDVDLLKVGPASYSPTLIKPKADDAVIADVTVTVKDSEGTTIRELNSTIEQ